VVSIIVPIYNVEKYINKCVESLMNQTFSDIEIILVDDGSKDASGKWCDYYAKKDARIKVIHQKNRGLSGARNQGIENAAGEWLLFVDGDDYVEPRFVECLYQEAVSARVDIAICNYAFKSEEGTEIKRSSYSFVPRMSPFDNLDALLLFENKQYGTFFDVVWNKLFRVSLFENVRFPEGISLVEDISIIPEIYYKAKRISVIEEKLYNYVYREGSLSNGSYNKEEDYRLRRPMMEQRLKTYRAWNVKELILLQCIHLYSLIDQHSDGKDFRLIGLQKEFRQEYFRGHYIKAVSGSRKFKFFLAAISLKGYNLLVEIKKHK